MFVTLAQLVPPMSALGQKQTCAVQKGMSALRQKRHVQRKRSCPLYPQERTFAVQQPMSALCQ